MDITKLLLALTIMDVRTSKLSELMELLLLSSSARTTLVSRFSSCARTPASKGRVN